MLHLDQVPENKSSESEENYLALYTAVSRLKSPERQVIELTLKDVATEQIAETLGLDRMQVEKLLGQALYHLRVSMGVKVTS